MIKDIEKPEKKKKQAEVHTLDLEGSPVE